ncbi:hypothetical protein Pint_11648 [Pistacia integerrima]|uniref:Uncharacterized protein n=1 Tax=Pistacia integerrima TaxID=434235 RepID=A0ACC0XFW9_9ROSI|nr:hypothetical protein Pint_11648 [Pistacia integerrima]
MRTPLVVRLISSKS